jgi:hypothetical protein
MKLSVLAVLVLLPACSSKEDDFPIGPGPGNIGSGGGIDASIKDAPSDTPLLIDANIFTGRVCLAADPSNLLMCAATGAGGLTVRLGTGVTTTAADGSFTIPGQSGSNLVWSVTGATIVSSYKPLSDFQIPAILTADFDTLKTNNMVTVLPGQGSVMVTVVRNGSGFAGVAATSNPTAAYAPFYDTTGSSTGPWSRVSTGANGTVWLPGLNVGAATVTAMPGPGQISTPSLPIIDGAITFATITFP